MQKVRVKLRDIWLSPARFRLPELLEKLNSVIRGWANYFRTGVSKEIFSGLDHWMFIRERRHTRRMHPKKGWKWRQKRYFGSLNLHRRDKWVFGDKNLGAHILKFSWFDIERHTLVKGSSSPDDPELRDYWRDREMKKVKNLRNKSRQTIAKNQNHRCPTCGESLYNGEELHLHHVKPKSEGGKDTYNNLRLLHLYCHQQTHGRK